MSLNYEHALICVINQIAKHTSKLYGLSKAITYSMRHVHTFYVRQKSDNPCLNGLVLDKVINLIIQDSCLSGSLLGAYMKNFPNVRSITFDVAHNIIGKLPESVTELNGRVDNFSSIDVPIKHISINKLDMLHRISKDIDITYVQYLYDATQLQSVPSNVKTLTIRMSNRDLDLMETSVTSLFADFDVDTSKLPLCLEELDAHSMIGNLDHLVNLKSLRCDDLGTCELPHSLTSLTTRVNDYIDLSRFTSIVSLTIDRFRKTMKLPSSLTYLRVLYMEYVPELPNCKTLHITHADPKLKWSKLRHGIQKLHIPYTHLTKYVEKQLPKSITELHVGKVMCDTLHLYNLRVLQVVKKTAKFDKLALMIGGQRYPPGNLWYAGIRR